MEKKKPNKSGSTSGDSSGLALNRLKLTFISSSDYCKWKKN